jgi:hypothetical protein
MKFFSLVLFFLSPLLFGFFDKTPHLTKRTPAQIENKSPTESKQCFEQLNSRPSLNENFKNQDYVEMDSEKILVTRCRVVDDNASKQRIYSLITPDGYRILKFPTYRYAVPNRKGGSSNKTLPVDLMKFKYKDKIYYLSDLYRFDEAVYVTSEDQVIPFMKNISDKNEMDINTVALIRHDKTYTTWLKYIPEVKELSEAESDYQTIQNCLHDRVGAFAVKLLQSEFLGEIPGYDQINIDMTKDLSSVEMRKKYLRTLDQIRDDIYQEMVAEVPACSAFLTPEIFAAAYTRTFSLQFNNYNTMRGNVLNRMPHPRIDSK